MRIEVAPWIKDYVVDMDEVYAELTFGETKRTINGEKSQSIQNIQAVFDSNCSKTKLNGKHGNRLTGKQRTDENQLIGKKILCKRDPGMGETIVGKKAGWNWAKGFFKTFQIVFFVFLW